MSDPNLKYATVFTIRKILKKHQINLLEELLTNVYPLLNADEQAKVLMQIMPYVYTKPKAKEVSKKKNKTVLPELPSASEVSTSSGKPNLATLLQLAATQKNERGEPK